MGTIIVQEHTTKKPITLIGEEAGICWGADTSNEEKNYKRGKNCIQANHGRTLEYPQVYLVIDGYSARVMREVYTHIGGAPTRLQASTRYIDYTEYYNNKEYVTPSSIAKNHDAEAVYNSAMLNIANSMNILEKQYKIPREDIAMLLPLGMHSKMVLRTNLRNLIDMSHQRLCSRANWEYRKLFKDIADALSNYSAEWQTVILNTFMPKCKALGYCPEERSCGLTKKSRVEEVTSKLEAAGYKFVEPDDLK